MLNSFVRAKYSRFTALNLHLSPAGSNNLHFNFNLNSEVMSPSGALWSAIRKKTEQCPYICRLATVTIYQFYTNYVHIIYTLLTNYLHGHIFRLATYQFYHSYTTFVSLIILGNSFFPFAVRVG